MEGLRRVGCFVQSLASIGKGCPDLLVGKAGSWLVLEVKDGGQVRLTPHPDACWR